MKKDLQIIYLAHSVFYFEGHLSAALSKFQPNTEHLVLSVCHANSIAQPDPRKCRGPVVWHVFCVPSSRR